MALATGIRTVRVNDQKMQPIKLRMGKASVLRFSEKPKKVVIGNQNYYAVEFIDNDLTIQPLGDVETNLFVYTPYHTYGFILKVCHACSYDDLVYVKWRSKSPVKRRKVSPRLSIVPGHKAIGLDFKIKDLLQVLIVKTSTDPQRSLRFIDLEVKSLLPKKNKLSLNSLRIVATRGDIPLPNQGFVVEKDDLKSNESSRARLFIPLEETKGFSINVLIGKERSKTIIGRKFLR